VNSIGIAISSITLDACRSKVAPVLGQRHAKNKAHHAKRVRVRFINSGYLKALERFATANRAISLFLAIPDGKPLHTFLELLRVATLSA
jgi:hypothetical protein